MVQAITNWQNQKKPSLGKYLKKIILQPLVKKSQIEYTGVQRPKLQLVHKHFNLFFKYREN